jgi:flagellar motor protein MotB
MSRNMMFGVGFGLAALIAILIGIALIVSGWLVSPEARQAALESLQNSEKAVSDLTAENKSLRSDLESLRSQVDSGTATIQGLESKIAEAQRAIRQAEDKADSAQAQVNVYVEEEQKVEFVVNRRQMEIEKLARQIHDLEGVQVQIVDNGLIVSGIASPFALGSARMQDDTLIPKLAEISKIYKAANQEHSNRYYAAAVGNTDATPIRAASSLHSNLWLGAKRARSLVEYMKSAGFPEEETFLISWGEIRSDGQTFHPQSRKAQLYIVAREAFQEVLTLPEEPTGAKP